MGNFDLQGLIDHLSKYFTMLVEMFYHISDWLKGLDLGGEDE